MLLGEVRYGEGWRSGASTSYIRAENTFGELPILMAMTELASGRALSQCHIFELGKTHFGKCSLKFCR